MATPKLRPEIGGASALKTSTRGDCLPAGIALGHVRVIAGGVGAIIPGLRRVGLTVFIVGLAVIVAVIRIVAVIVVGVAVIPPVRRVNPTKPAAEPTAETPEAMVEPASMKPAAVKSAPMEPTKAAAVKSAPMEPTKAAAVKSAPMEPAEAAAVKSTTTAMEATTTASAMRSIGHLRLEDGAGTEQSSRGPPRAFSAPGPACIAANRFHRSLLLKRRGSHV